MKKIIFFIFLLCFCMCGTTGAAVIKGRVLDERWFPVPNVTVIVSGGGATLTDKDGNFAASTEIVPFNITVFDYANSGGVIYTAISSASPELILFGAVASRNINTEYVKVDFPPVPQGKTVLLKFISDKTFYCPDVIANPGEKSKMLTIDWLSNSNSINGRIIYLEKSPAAYDKYLERAVTVYTAGYPQSVMFDSLAFYNTPGESYLTVYLPVLDYDAKGFSVYADFLSMHRNAEILLNNTEGNIISTKVLVPKTLPMGYRLKISGRGYNKGGEGFDGYVYSYPGSVCNLDSETPPELEAPQDKLYTVNNKTVFAYERGSGTGIYVVHFHCFEPVGDFYVVTRERQIYLPFGIAGEILKGIEYSWQVSKYNTYFSVDDFVKERIFANDIGYKAVLKSAKRIFRTRPF